VIPNKTKVRNSRNEDAKELLENALRTDACTIDQLYGLEPVFEPSEGSTDAALDAYLERQCPHCGETIGSVVDLTDSSREFIEDCQVCCRPMRVLLEMSTTGVLLGITTARLDD
jgi:hypothetical protein